MSKEHEPDNQAVKQQSAANTGGSQGVALTPPTYANGGQGEGQAEEDPLQVNEGQITFDAEGNDDPNSRFFTRTIHYPPVGDSGVTMGRGYDMGNRSQEEIRNHLQASGFDASKIAILVQAAGLKGNQAAQYVRNNKERVGVITHDQQKMLFQIVYQELKNDVIRITTKSDVESRYGETDLENLHPAIMELVVDLRYRGDYHPRTRQRIQPLMVNNDLQGLTTLMADRGYWVDTYNVPLDRFNRRNQFMQDAVNGNYTRPITGGGQTQQGTEGEGQQNEGQQTNLNTGATWDSHTNRRIEGIHPSVKQYAYAFVNQIQSELGKTVRVTSGLRTYAEQDELYAKGRTAPGGKVTNARGGQSYHNFGLAIDIVEIDGRQANWNGPWEEFGRIGRSLGWEWGGDWSGFVDKPHFQMTFGLSTAQLRQLYAANGGNFVSLDSAPDRPGPLTGGGTTDTPTTSDPEGSMGTGTVTASRLNVRSGPGSGNPIVGKLNSGASVTIHQIEGDWLMIGEGQWVHGGYVNQTLNQNAQPAGPTGSGTVTASKLNVRSGAGTSFGKVDALDNGSQLDIYESDGDWLRIGDNQWVHGNYVDQSGGEEAATEQATVTARNSLNVRSGPGTENEKIGSLPSGASVDIYAREGDWARIGDGEWVHGSFLSTSPERDTDSGTGGTPGGANKEGWDINAAVAHLNSSAEPRSIGYCARYVRQAMEAGGLSTAGRPGSAKGYVSFLPSIGFTEIETSSYIPGDIVVFDAVPGHVHGHIAMWNGSQWVSDFKQRSMIVASGYSNGTYHIYRWQ